MGMKKILVIDYDQSSLASLQGILAKEGYEVVTAADGQAGWDKYNKESPDLVLMEAMLPKVHGFELCQRITSERNSQATVFIMTGVYKDRVYRTEALRTYGASEYFEKPLKMAELLASIEAVIGKPAVKPAEAMPTAEPAPVKPVREIKPESVFVESRKRERPKSDDNEFSLPADLDQLSREIRKPAPVRHEPTAEARLESLADELLKTVIVEPVPHKTVEAKPAGGNGNGNGNAEIDQFLKSALADFDLNKEKVKVPKPAPPTPPPATEKPKPVPPVDDGVFSAPFKPALKITLTPGDPGSDVSPFFTPSRPKPEVPAEKPRVQAPPAPQVPPAPVIPQRPIRPVEKAEKRPEPVRQEPVRHEPVRHEPVRHEPKVREAEALASTDIFQEAREDKGKKGFPVLVAVGAGVVVVAALGFFILRPKHVASLDDGLKAQQTVTPASVPAQPVAEVPPPETKPAPVKQKAEPKPKPKEPDPSAEAIIPQVAPSAALPQVGSEPEAGKTGNPAAAVSNPVQADPPPVKTEEPPPQGTATESGTAADPGTTAAAPAMTPSEAPVKEGDLVELSAVTEPPKQVKTTTPVYPPTAQSLGVEGMITVNALIDEKGNVIDTGILKGIQDDKGLSRAAETAVKKWKFQPARKNGVAVKVWKPFVIAFKADKKPAGMIE
jgi:TonB family protein